MSDDYIPTYNMFKMKKKRGPYKKRAPKAVAKVANAVVTRVMNRVDEKKFYDFTTSFSPGSTGAVTAFHAIGQGDDNNQRNGKKITVKNVRFTCSLQQNAANPSTEGTQVRFTLFKDNQQVADTSAIATDLANQTGPNWFLNPNHMGRFSILKDFTVNLSPAGVVSKQVKLTKYFKKGLNIRYNGTTSTDIQKNGIYLYVVSNALSTEEPLVSYNARTTYVDS